MPAGKPQPQSRQAKSSSTGASPAHGCASGPVSATACCGCTAAPVPAWYGSSSCTGLLLKQANKPPLDLPERPLLLSLRPRPALPPLPELAYRCRMICRIGRWRTAMLRRPWRKGTTLGEDEGAGGGSMSRMMIDTSSAMLTRTKGRVSMGLVHTTAQGNGGIGT
jgi:hypothetical protein